jgi:threonine dehydratase
MEINMSDHGPEAIQPHAEPAHAVHELGQLGLGEASLVVAETVYAAERLRDIMEPTPLTPAPKFTAELGVPVHLKREDMTVVHSFKLRGAFYMMSRLEPAQRERGVLAASAGNHAQGVALSAQALGIPATIVMPTTTPAIKVEAVRDLGADVVLAGDNYSEAYDHSQALLADSDQVFVHPFDDPEVIVGQGTVGKEILDSLPSTTHIFVPVGGGGLISGVAQYVKSVRPDVRVIGVEPEDSNAMQAAHQAGHPVVLPHVGIFAYGVAVKRVGDETFRLTERYVDELMTVSNDEIAAAVEVFFNETRGILEPAGALAIAAARAYAHTHDVPADSVFVPICSGANMPFRKLQFMAERNEIGSGREALFAIQLHETAGALLKLCKDVVNGHNITEFKYRLKDRDEAHIFVGFNMSDAADKERFIQKLADYDYTFADLSADDFAKEHVRHMVGGGSTAAENESLYEIQFPEKPGALTDFLEALGTNWNISLFHYRGLGGDTGKVLIGFESPDTAALEEVLAKATADFSPVHSMAAELFL